MPLKRILLKLKVHGIGDGIIDWIEQWLTDRRRCVVVDGEVSNWKSILSGVPQGSVLGPLVFLIYINDLTFADDTKVFRRINDGDKQHLQNDLDKLDGLRNCRCCSTLGNENAYIRDTGTWM